MTDLMAWNAEQTRMPYLMHAQYLRALFLEREGSWWLARADWLAAKSSDQKVPAADLAAMPDLGAALGTYVFT